MSNEPPKSIFSSKYVSFSGCAAGAPSSLSATRSSGWQKVALLLTQELFVAKSCSGTPGRGLERKLLRALRYHDASHWEVREPTIQLTYLDGARSTNACRNIPPNIDLVSTPVLLTGSF